MRFVAIYRHPAKGNVPAMLKGFLKIVIMPGVAFGANDPHKVKAALAHRKRNSVAEPMVCRSAQGC